MDRTVCLITGANGGLGAATAHALARAGVTVVMACRDRGRGEAVRAAITAATDTTTVDLLLVDLARPESVRDAVATFHQHYDRLDLLINNAAVFTRQRVVTPDGLETMFATNHLGHFLLTTLLLDRLRASTPARVITITAPSTTALDFSDLQGERTFRAFTAFGASKMCNLLFTFELARQLDGTGVTANAVHPGLVRSHLLQGAPAPLRWAAWLVSASPERAARGVVQVATSPALAGVTGQFFKGSKTIEANAYARDREVQRRLWEVSVALVGLAPSA
jgi:NAD(P)-dependent dehydrogenase (short-subunit alcohol dehydrogenase family)